jgi:hypothetical protein
MSTGLPPRSVSSRSTPSRRAPNRVSSARTNRLSAKKAADTLRAPQPKIASITWWSATSVVARPQKDRLKTQWIMPPSGRVHSNQTAPPSSPSR